MTEFSANYKRTRFNAPTPGNRELICATVIPGKKPGERIGLVKWYEKGYYQSTMDSPEYTLAQAELAVLEFNTERGIAPDVAESAADGSMFGWHTPAANRAIEFFKQATLAEAQ
jgi:hypothetical protein